MKPVHLALVAAAVVAAGSHALAAPVVTSATLTYHLDASQSITHGGDGTTITDWKELTTGTSVNIQGTPTFQSTGLTGGAAVRFDGAQAAGTKDLIFSNNAPINSISARTIFVVATMGQDSPATTLSALIANSDGNEAIRQTDVSESAAYFTGNSGDFHSGGSFFVNGVAQFAIPGGFDAAHIVESVSSATVTMASLRIGNNAFSRQWKGDVSEVLVYNGLLSADDRNAVGVYLENKYGITGSYFVIPAPAALPAGLGLIAFAGLRRRRRTR